MQISSAQLMLVEFQNELGHIESIETSSRAGVRVI
jgi:hypothetical protein